MLICFPVNAEESKIRRNASFALLLPGKVLHLSALIVARKFRDRGNKAGALEAMQLLDECGMGKLLSVNSVCGTDKVSACYVHMYVDNFFVVGGACVATPNFVTTPTYY